MLKELVNRLTISSLAGVDLGSSALKVTEVNQDNGKVSLQRCAILPVDQANPADQLKAALLEAQIESTDVVLGVVSPEAIVKRFDFPPMPKKELAKAIQLEAEQAILNGHELSGMAIDWHLLSCDPKTSIRGLLAVVPKNAIASIKRTAREAGLRPAVVDVEGLALWNAYWALVGSKESSPQTVLIMNVGVKTTNLIIAKGPDQLLLARDIQLGAAAITEGEIEDWTDEVRDSLRYARSKAGLRNLDGIVLTGGGADLDLVQVIQSAIGVPAQLWNPLDQLAWDQESLNIDHLAGRLLTIAIGLALRKLA